MKKYILSLLTLLAVYSCNDDRGLLDTEPQGDVSQQQINDLVAEFPEKAVTALSGAEAGNNLYLIQFNTNGTAGHDDFGYMSARTGLDHMTNDLTMSGSHWFVHYYNYTARNVESVRTETIWRFYYKVIFNMNNVLSAESLIGTPPDAGQGYVKGRALAVRANAYMDLLNTYAKGSDGIPYISLGDRVINNAGRVPTSTVWEYIIEDLNQSYTLLEGFSRSSKEQVNQKIVAGFLARAYMFTKNYPKAAEFAAIAKTGGTLMTPAQLKDGFQHIDNQEWMWGADVSTSTSTVYASFFSQMSNISPGYAGLLGVTRAIDSRLYSKIPDNDYRKEWFMAEDGVVVGPYDGEEYELSKYDNVKFYDNTFFEGDYIFMRAAEFYLIEAEALARTGNETGARSVLETLVKTRTIDGNYSAAGYAGTALLEEIRKQRKIELWGEGGEWWEMKRNGEDLERNYTGTNHPSFGRLNIPASDDRFRFMIPQAELNANPNVSN